MSSHIEPADDSTLSVAASRSAAILIIGNEILSGKVTDENSPYLARELRALGVALHRVEVVPDDIDLIAEAVGRMSRNYDFVFTSGGVGPTHDDVTIAGVARGLGCDVVRHPVLEDVLRRYYGDTLNDARLRMADVPDGAEVIHGDRVRIPVVMARNVTIFPGIPELLRKEFNSIRERFQGTPFYCRRAYVTIMEGDMVRELDEITAHWKDVDVGSYPVFDESIPYRVMLTFDSKTRASADAALERLIKLLPADRVYRVE